ncbi:J domain-containing protein [Pelagibacterium montanilacus]|uniref:J domain-containing protein n=1 Tax=Pelagibacterium montanilacus TaxID=2185280 RepID=UPI000F8EF14B|nr:J domain-containing protein [Pelagibacterium montanilacus]
MTAAYPLQWPDHIERSRTREVGRFKTTLPSALGNVETSLHRFASDSRKKISGLVISSNYSLAERKPADPGVSVWFNWDDMQICIPVDRYSSVEANLQAIHHVIEARRTELRHGTLALVRATFRGFQALPPPSADKAPHWTKVLGLAANEAVGPADIERAYRQLAKKRHPDHGGSDQAMAELNAARAAGLKAIGA